jgi:hypothetical protein
MIIIIRKTREAYQKKIEGREEDARDNHSACRFFTFVPLFLQEIERKDDERLITRVLQRETNRAQLAVCPPPESRTTCSFYRWEVDRMPINSVRNPLLNPHES